MFAWITLGFLIGLQHALEADHIAAVASLAARKTGLKRIVRHGAIWGIGHSCTLAIFGGAVFALKLSLDERLSHILEFAVGLMLVLLGGRIIHRMFGERIHFHVHSHADGDVHFHAHSHLGDGARHNARAHCHSHERRSMFETFGVGMVHGLAGTAALVALAASGAPEAAFAFLFIVLFGLGSVVGMAAFSAVIALPLTFTARGLTWANRSLQIAAGLAALGFGLHIAFENVAALAAAG